MKRRLVWLYQQAYMAAGLLVCFALMVLFLPLVPVWKLLERVQRAWDELE